MKISARPRSCDINSGSDDLEFLTFFIIRKNKKSKTKIEKFIHENSICSLRRGPLRKYVSRLFQVILTIVEAHLKTIIVFGYNLSADIQLIPGLEAA